MTIPTFHGIATRLMGDGRKLAVWSSMHILCREFRRLKLKPRRIIAERSPILRLQSVASFARPDAESNIGQSVRIYCAVQILVIIQHNGPEWRIDDLCL